MIALTDFPYNMKSLRKNDRFDAVSESDAHVLETVRHAKRAAQKPETKSLTPEKSETKVEPKAEAKDRKHEYKTRNMTAEKAVSEAFKAPVE